MSKYQIFQRERKINRILIIILLILFISLLGLNVYRIFFSDYYYDDYFKMQLIPVLNQDFNQREQITAADIHWIKVPASIIESDTIVEKSALVNKFVKLGCRREHNFQ